ncbi:hypothetical protein DL767_003046 [Monosporascus sp. MG133]|nr:hypothetical protein DL767_003046 [Monosporascus sp. MG133]
MATATNPPPFMSSSSGPLPPRAGFQPAVWNRSQSARDVSSLHPVFFTERPLRRSPFAPAAVAAAAAGTSPVAHGYVYQAAARRSGGGTAVARL